MKIGDFNVEEKDYKEKIAQLEEQLDNAITNYDNEYEKRYRLDSENRELKRTNDKLLDIIKNLSEGIAAK